MGLSRTWCQSREFVLECDIVPLRLVIYEGMCVEYSILQSNYECQHVKSGSK